MALLFPTSIQSQGQNLSIFATSKRISDSLNEGLPIKNGQKKICFKEIDSFPIKRIVGSNSQINRKSDFLIGQVPIKKYGYSTYRK